MPTSQQRSLTSFFKPKTALKTATSPPKSTDMPRKISPKSPTNCGSKRAVEDTKTSPSSEKSPETNKRPKVDSDGSSCKASSQGKVTLPINEPGWAAALASETSKPYFRRLEAFLDTEYASRREIFPPREKIFNAFDSCPIQNVKVVILGQDPYHAPGQAHGLAFSVMKGVRQPPSLRNMITEAVNCCGIRPTKAGTLDAWCNQGVFLLNNLLSVERSKPASHKNKGWEQFTDAVIRELNKGDRRLVFMLWGKPSQKKGCFIDSSKHRVLKCAHPSPLSATKGSDPFIGSACFAKANDALVELGHDKIDWNIE